MQDDIIDTAGTIVKAASALKANGADARVRLRGARRAVGPGDRAARSGADRPGDHHEHDPADDRAGEGLQEDQAAVGRAPARAGDSEHSRGDVGLFAVRVSGAARHCRTGAGNVAGPVGRTWLRAGEAGLSYGSNTAGREARDAGQERGAAAARERAGSRPSSTAPRRARRSTIAVDPKVLLRILHSESGVNTLIGLEGLDGAGGKRAGQGVPARSDRPQAAPRRLLPGRDGQDADASPCRSCIKGEPKGVKQQGGIVDFVNREIEIECLPADIPRAHRRRHHRADAAPGRPRARPAPKDGKWKPIERRRHDDRPRRRAEGRRGGDADAAAAAAAPGAAAEPEVIKKGKKDEDEDKPEAEDK